MRLPLLNVKKFLQNFNIPRSRMRARVYFALCRRSLTKVWHRVYDFLLLRIGGRMVVFDFATMIVPLG